MLKPKCHPYWFVNGDIVKNPKQMSAGHTANGYIIPCCMVNPQDKTEDIHTCGIYDEELKLKYHSTTKTIFLSPQWVRFHNTLVNDPDNSPNICKKYCYEQ
jgi:hypothetical protein